MSTRAPRSHPDPRKLERLCAQVEQAVSLALGGSEDERLRDLTVESVEPAPDGTRLLVSVVPAGGASLDELDDLYAALGRARGWLRQQVAAEIHRKRTPDLSFRVLPRWPGEH